MSTMGPIHTMLATLGGQPQVVTFTLDLLLARGIPIREVVVVHPANYPNIESAIHTLQSEFIGECYQRTGEPMHFRRHALSHYNSPINDIMDEQSADGALNAMNKLINELKAQQRVIHFSISGGRRLMGYLSFSAALLNFDQADRLWHLHTPKELQQRAKHGQIMHVEPDAGVRLIEVPFARLSQPLLARLLSPDPQNVRVTIDALEDRNVQEMQQRCHQVVEQLTSAQKAVLTMIARDRLTPQEIAERQDRTIATISSHLNKIYAHYRNAWGIPEGGRFDYRDLRDAFAPYFASRK